MDRFSPSPFVIGRAMMSLWVPQAIHAAAELGLADALSDEPTDAETLAAQLKTHPDATKRLLDAIFVLGYVERRNGGYSLTALGRLLRSDADSSRRAWARLMGGPPVWRAWGKLAECVRTGSAAYATGEKRLSETETFDAMFADPEAAEVFHRAMADGTKSMARAVVDGIDLRNFTSVVDVGGGHGALLCALLEAHSHVEGAVFDLEHARSGALRTFSEHGLGGRARFVSGDLFEEAPPHADVFVLKSVVHDWSDERARLILESCARAMTSQSRLILVEPPAADPEATLPEEFAWIVAFSDLNMLVNTGGRERTVREYTALAESAGLVHVETLRPPGSFYASMIFRLASGC